LIIIVALALGIVLGGALIFVLLQRRTTQLREHFGPEYERTVQESGNRLTGEVKLLKRQKRVEQFHLRPLSSSEQNHFQTGWREVQSRFVDDPATALTQADKLIGEVMAVEGYPILDFDQRASDISVDHPLVVENYREAHAIAVKNLQGGATTEDLRRAMIHYRTLFDELIGQPQTMLAERIRA
jgi:hypothetical protein